MTADDDSARAQGAARALRVRGLTVEYLAGGHASRPLDGLDVDVAAGSCALLQGPSGCGKTTLLSCLAGILTPKSGTVTFGDTEVTGLEGKARVAYRRNTVGVVFQAFNLVPSLTAQENVMAPMLAAGKKRGAAVERARDLLEQVGLSDRVRHRPGQLSGGQQQRVAIARALVHDPPLLLADEPTAHLDQVQVDGVLELLAGLSAPDRVVVIATHDDRLHRITRQVVDLSRRSTPLKGPLGPSTGQN